MAEEKRQPLFGMQPTHTHISQRVQVQLGCALHSRVSTADGEFKYLPCQLWVVEYM